MRNAQVYLRLLEEHRSFGDWLWAFVDHAPQLPPHPLTICYAFMQSVGMVDDHLVGCFKYRANTACHGEVISTCVKDHAPSVARVS